MPADNTEVSARNQQEISSRPDDPEALFNQGLAFLAESNLLEASACFERAIYLKPDNAPAYYNLGQALRSQGRLIEAANAYRRAISMAPNMAGPHLSFGELKLFHGNLGGALESLRNAAELEPDSAAIQIQLGKALRQSAQYGEAETAFKKALDLNPDSAEALALYGEMLGESGRSEEASTLLERAVALEPTGADPYLSFVNSRKMGSADKPVVSRLNGLLRQEGATPEERGKLHFALGKALDDLGDYRGAIRNFDEANGIEIAKRQVSRQYFNKQSYRAFAEGIMRAFSKEFFDAHKGLGSTSDLPVFLIGATGAETEMCAEILLGHPDIGIAGELSFWHKKGMREMSEAGGLPSANKVAEVAREYEANIAALLPGKKSVVNTLPHNFLLLGPIHLAFPRARIIHCKRNPLDTCLEIYMTFFAGSSPPYAHERENIVFFHEIYERLTTHWRETLSRETFLEIECEEVARDPQAAARSVAEFCGLTWKADYLDESRNVPPPLTSGARQASTRLPIGHWQHYEPWLGVFSTLKQGGKEVQESKSKSSKT